MSGFRAALACVLLAAAVFAAYGGAPGNGFAWDDDGLIFIGAVTRRPLDWRAVFMEPVDRLYRPLRTLTYIAEFELGGRNPALFHLTNVTAHAAVCILIFLLMLRLSRNFTASAVAALLFGTHPIHAGSVAFVSGGRSDLLAAALALLSLIFYLRSREPESGKAAYPLSLAAFALALGAKESAAVVPALVVCLALMRRGEGRPAREWVGIGLFFVVLAVYVYFRFFLLDVGRQSSGYHGGGLLNTLLTTVTVWATYVRDLLFPTNLCPVYAVDIQHHFTARVAGAAAAPALLAAAALFGLLRKQVWGFGLAWFFIALLPVSNLIPINSLKSDRFLYLPAIGMMIAVSDLASRLAFKVFGREKKRIAAAAIVVFAVAAAAWLISITRPAVAVWKNDETLWTKAAACASRSGMAWNNLAKVHFASGRMEEAVFALKNAERFNPDDPLVYNNLADAYGFRGDYEWAIYYLERALKLDPGNPAIYLKMGFALMKKGEVKEARRRIETGIELCRGDAACISGFDSLSKILIGREGENR